MSERDTARGQAVTILCEAEKEGAQINALLQRALETASFPDERDYALLNALVVGVMSRRIALDDVIDRYANAKTNQMKPLIRNALRCAVYQILFMDRIPDSAAVDSAVKLTRDKGFRTLTGFVNGVLRAVVRDQNDIDFSSDDVRYSVPKWIYDKLVDAYGAGEISRALRYQSEAHPLTARVKPDAFPPSADQHPLLPYAYRLPRSGAVEKTPGFAEGAFMVQDAASMLVVEAAGIKQGDTVVDVCAAPGGKALHATEKGAGRVYAFDKSKARCERIGENVRRMRADNVTIEARDALTPDETLFQTADVVLCDVPCSGLGVLSRKPDVKYRLKETDIAELQRLQRAIADASVAYLKAGGVLVYSTCTLTPEENEENVAYLSARGDLTLSDLTPYVPAALRALSGCKQGYLTLLPGRFETDGFFIARFVKTGAAS